MTGQCEYIEMVEIDKKKCEYLKANFTYLRRVLQNHIPDFEFNVVCKDVRKYETGERFDVITASPPCEDFSVLRGLSNLYGVEIKGTLPLTERTIEIVEEIKPELALYENVVAESLKKLLRQRGWRVEVHDMSTVIPQRRRRIIARWNGYVQRWI